ncbi:MAG: FtsH protease activity modulator HflK [Gammaproteobacteria bacterium]|nr:FtsH protease activity modulator HflK [Gammaproteobacteria bacterium]
MAWNEPGNNNDKKDPWGNNGGNRGNNQGPPDLDEAFRNFQKKLSGIFGGNNKGSGSSSSSGGGMGIGVIAAIVITLWAASGIYKVEQAERGIVMQFGAYKETVQSGLHWHLPRPIQNVVKVNVAKVYSIGVEETMLTQDTNIVDIEGTIQYRVDNPTDYIFNTVDPEVTLKNSTESALRESIGRRNMDFVITEGRATIAADVQKLTQEIVDQYKTGLTITEVNIRQAKPPEAVKAAFDDVNKALEDKVRFLNEAEAYRNEVVPKARGAAARLKAESESYQLEVIARAEGNAGRFTSLLKEYKQAPGVTRDRLYIDMVEHVLSNSTKVMVDVKGNNMMFLPLDKILQGSGMTSKQSTNVLDSLSAGDDARDSGTGLDDLRNRIPSRSRETR